jgi:hypothetical protein
MVQLVETVAVTERFAVAVAAAAGVANTLIINPAIAAILAVVPKRILSCITNPAEAASPGAVQDVPSKYSMTH